MTSNSTTTGDTPSSSPELKPKSTASSPPVTTTPARRTLLTLIGIATAGLLLLALSDVLAPFLFAALLAYAVNPLVNKLAEKGLPRSVGSALAILVFILLLIALVISVVPLLVELSGRIALRAPSLLSTLQTQILPWLHQKLGITITLDFPHLSAFIQEHANELRALVGKLASSIGKSGKSIFDGLVFAVLVPVVLYYLLVDWKVVTHRLNELIPRRWSFQANKMLTEIDDVLGQFLRGQLSVMLLLAIYYALTLWLAGLDFALPVGLITGLLIFIPYLGFSLGLILAVTTALLQDGGNPILWVALIYGVGQVIEGFLLTPWLVGERIGLHPVAVIFALLAFGQLFGFAGLLLALPAAAALLVALRTLHQRYLASDYYNQR